MVLLDSYLENTFSVAISGHIRPDGDCVGSALAVYNYICGSYPDIAVDLYLDPIPNKFRFLKCSDHIQHIDEPGSGREYDLFIALDCADPERLGKAARYFETAKSTLCVDHHISNSSFADFNYIFPDASSASELVYQLMDRQRLTKEIAECIYVGLIHDTGVFRYSCTSSKTMRIAGELMDMGIDYPRIVDETFYLKTYEQIRIWGKAMLDSELYLDGICIYSLITRQDMEEYHVQPKHLDGIVSQLRSTKDVEVAIFLYQIDGCGYKISLRSASYVDVAKIAAAFGGGGHCRAAGASSEGTPEEIKERILAMVAEQVNETGECPCTTEL